MKSSTEEMMPPRTVTLSLYKQILRVHRGLPSELQALGTPYVRDEFKRHKNVEPKEADKFIRTWAVSILLSLDTYLSISLHFGSVQTANACSCFRSFARYLCL